MEHWNMTELQSSIWNKKYNYKQQETTEMWLDRVSGGNENIKKRIINREFLFGGRILSNRGLDRLYGKKVTYSNCYVLKPPSDTIWDEDNDDSIWTTSGKMARTYSVGGGVGISLRNIRPRGTEVNNNARTTTGAVSFMPLYSLTTETIGQEGRRGALMLSIPSSHPDLEEFIDVKTQQGAVTGANISIEVDDRFMIAAKRNELYRLHFTVEATGEVVEKWVDAKKLYKKIIQNNLDWAEPGMLYWNNIEKWHLMSHHPKFKYVGTNPCAEEPLPAGGSCLLGSLNLSEFVRNPFTKDSYFDEAAYVLAIRDAVVALNEVLDEGLHLHPLKEQRQAVKELRQIGLGVMGIADMLVMLGITYGDERSLELCERLADLLANHAMQQSALIAAEKGTFDWYEWDYISQSDYFKTVAWDKTKELVAQHGLRNSQILCIAPTGSLSTMLGISGGIEPFFSLGYYRTTKSLHGKDVTYWVDEPIVEKYRRATGNNGDLPSYFVTAQEGLHWKQRIDMQAVWQKYIDASISSTVNLPNDATLEDTMDLYMYAWEKGLKGCTIYRAGCKREGILTLEAKPAEKISEETVEKVEAAVQATKAQGYFSTCPDCGSEEMWHIDGCVTCKDCGFSPCS
jgi:ribonucleoside-diphosphate reductase alpha chain